MRVFVAGATGAIGRPLVALLLEAGHDVAAMTRSPERAAALRARGVDAVVADALDPDGTRRAIVAARPEVVVHQLTDLPARIDLRHYERDVGPTSHLREVTGPLFARAAREAGARRLVAQSVSFLTAPQGPPVLDEAAPAASDMPGAMGRVMRGTLALERAVTGAEALEGVVLRYGFFYGPGTAYGPGGSLVEDVRRRRLPIVGAGTGLSSFVSVDDAAAATMLALDRAAPGIYNVTDDEPIAQRDWVRVLAEALGAPAPFRIPLWIARLVAGPVATAAVTARGASNAKARRELGWAPRWPSVREGFPAVLAADPQGAAGAGRRAALPGAGLGGAG